MPIEVCKCEGERRIVWLSKLFYNILKTKRMHDEWRRSTLVPIYKNKGDSKLHKLSWY